MVKVQDVVVVGGGAMGSAAAWHATKRGMSTVLLEQFEPDHHRGASHGATRNFNQAYTLPDYIDLVREAGSLWHELAEDNGRTLIDTVGLVNHGWSAALNRTREALSPRGIPNETIPRAEAEERWPEYRFATDVLYLPMSGRVRSADALIAFRESTRRRGGDLRYGTVVRAIDVRGDDLAVVVTEAGEIHARRVIVAAGAWTADLLGSSIALPRLRVTQESPAHFGVRTSGGSWPSLNHTPDPDRATDVALLSPVYGMMTPGEGVKVGWHGVGPEVHPDRRDFAPDLEHLARLRRYVDEWVPGADSTVAESISCTYTTTDTEDFVLDRVGPIIVGAGFSGQGFKFTPAIGRILVDLAEGIPSPLIFRPGLRVREANPVTAGIGDAGGATRLL